MKVLKRLVGVLCVFPIVDQSKMSNKGKIFYILGEIIPIQESLCLQVFVKVAEKKRYIFCFNKQISYK